MKGVREAETCDASTADSDPKPLHICCREEQLIASDVDL